MSAPRVARDSGPVRAHEITDKKVYVGRRRLLAGAAAAGTLAGAGIFFDRLLRVRTKTAHGARFEGVAKSPWSTTEPPTPYEHVTTYNNFYELETDKYAPSRLGGTLRTRPWTVSFEGEIARPQVLDVDTLIRRFPLEERVYRFRCVEGWSMVIPWVGFPLGDLVRSLAPTSRARFVEFTTLFDPSRLPGQRRPVLAWPYVEGLRIDEAVHPLTILAVGLYGEALPAQNGAPIRLVVPWKYGFKGGKSIVRIRFTETQPETTWVKASPKIYGFQSNVNPAVSPAWSQADEFRLGEVTRRPTLLFNGYADQVGSMYAGMDLTKEI